MAISAVSSVSFRNNYNNIQFEGRKKEKKSHGGDQHHHSSTPVKAASLAAVMLMSPMITSSAEYNAATVNGYPVEMATPDLRSFGFGSFEFMPMPAHFNVLGISKGEEVFNDQNTKTTDFKLIDTDGDPSDYELIEYIGGGKFNGKYSVLERGIIRGLEFRSNYGDNHNEKGVRAYGIWLDNNDLSNYAPANAIFYTDFVGENFYDLFKGILTLPENRAVWQIDVTKGQNYNKLHQQELEDYKRRLAKPC